MADWRGSAGLSRTSVRDEKEKMRRLGRLLSVAIAMLLLPVSLIVFNGGDLTRPVESLKEITGVGSPTQPPPGEAGETTGPLPTKEPVPLPPDHRPPGEARFSDEAGLSTEEVISIAREACAQTLEVGNCDDYPVEVQKLSGEAGRAVSEASWSTRNEVYSSQIRPVKVILDPWLKDQDPQYVKHVATHEWNHVEQYLLAQTPERYDEMQERANDYFDAIANTPLRGTTGGIELLTDCMTVVGDGVEMGPGREGPTSYVLGLTSAQSTEEACGDGWRDLLVVSEPLEVR